VQQDIPIIATSSLSAPIRMEAGEDEEGDNEEEHKLNVEVLELSDMISIHDMKAKNVHRVRKNV
jgi:hypothetical protein